MIKGVVSRVSAKQNSRGYTMGLCINDNWYNLFDKYDTSAKFRDKLVSFDYTEDDRGFKKVNPNSMVVAEPEASRPTTGTAAPTSRAYTSNETGIKVGHALNNAVQLAIADKDTSEGNILDRAEQILSLSVSLEKDFSRIVSEAKEGNVKKQEAPPTPVRRGRKPNAAKQEVVAESSDDFDDDLPF